MRKTTIAATLLSSVLMAGSAGATVIGTAVSGIGSSTPVGSTNSDGSINYYASLNGSGTYGAGAGTTPDACLRTFFFDTCTGGTLDMWLRFDPESTGSGLLTLAFDDLDLIGASDTNSFFESLSLFDAGGTNLASISATTDPGVVGAATNTSTQLIELLVDVTTDPFYMQLSFATDFVNAPQGIYLNTRETVLATLVSVPEPATLSLLGLGLMLISASAVRRRRSVQRAI